MADYARARLNMVESQIRPNKVTDERLIEAFLTLPREAFVDRARQAIAYVDEDLALGDGRYLTEPMVLGRLIQTVAVRATDVVLDVGCATGYSTAVLSRLAATVVGLESDPGLVEAANQTLSRLGADNAVVVRGPLASGLPAQGPYDAIVVQGSIPAVPPALLDQLAEGGRLAAVLREAAGPGRATLMIKVGGVVSRRVVFDANTRPLPGFVREERFAF